MLCLMSAVLLSGCVSTGEYEAEKAKALNFQRLLAQEEQRTDELDARLQEMQQEVSSLGSQNRELAAERDALRDQASQQQPRVQDGSASGSASGVDLSPDTSFSDSALSEFELSDFSFDESEFNDLGMQKAEAGRMEMEQPGATGMGTPTYYTVVKGDTLYRISRKYGVEVEQLKKWNNLTDNIIGIGQRLIVSQP
ncbi:MAG: LysM peptidoglycan-binding domain-containing protein [Nitrospira sp. SB0677_bin_15]|nr:LysM peptidoglycan-binding domain-containing protein [Nitrospira sp. SB0667_bin_9]MYD31759.1 LysM peptidoglycan-binding domain-containing protein [Nitrospira sp. SB0661_bin_20]MYG40908.1 LysM peptidoglycan-binding domain-containing protein [Nitrospira sp. SB0677_bin_15]MYH02812.1 LysM peptidoglycan-binding domain-containing protein [Nitrospira sp. SB0675_bin_23]MYJ22508.1 LysM peptidoglycan-binding domain-containing protein [Nitrospira sp. SB0673_bin_12]